jgi:hypothetical protein
LTLARHNRGSIVAVAAALIVFLQSIAIAWSAAAMPAGPQFDAFGNPLCIAGTAHGGGDQGDDPSSLPNCCTFACGNASPALALPSGTDAALLTPPDRSAPQLSTFRTINLAAPEHDPGSPRAPPLAA